jgi:lipopolysaccharide/colanic/teichoic acid biosynthesis glycosyltransferase
MDLVSLLRIRIKRAMDIVGATGGLAVLGIPMIVIALLVWARMGRPVLFRQSRPGQNGHSFLLIKFRTMTNSRGLDGALLSDKERLTPFGLWLRETSLDELPELFNILKGEMSLVGPRPLLNEYLDRYSLEQARRHEVKPGLTGWAQVKGRNSLSWDEKFGLDVWYVDNRSIWLDLKILVITIVRVLRREGINAEGYATMPNFRGTRPDTRTGKDGHIA